MKRVEVLVRKSKRLDERQPGVGAVHLLAHSAREYDAVRERGTARPSLQQDVVIHFLSSQRHHPRSTSTQHYQRRRITPHFSYIVIHYDYERAPDVSKYDCHW